MSNQYIPHMKIDKVYIPCSLSTGTAVNKTECSRIIDPYMSYSDWEQYDADFTAFKNVTLLCSIEEATYTEDLTVPTNEIPNGARLVHTFQKRIQREVKPTPSAAVTSAGVAAHGGNPLQGRQQEINSLVQLYMISQRTDYVSALRCATEDVRKKYAVAPAASTPPAMSTGPGGVLTSTQGVVISISNASSPAYDTVSMSDVQVTRIVGPFNKGAKFDTMLFNILTHEGILHRSNSDKYYTVRFDDGKGRPTNAPRRLPVLIKDATKQKAPAYFTHST